MILEIIYLISMFLYLSCRILFLFLKKETGQGKEK